MKCQKCGQEFLGNGDICQLCQTQQVVSSVQSEPASKLQTAALVMGILGFVIPFIASILAIIFSLMTLKERPNKKAKIGLLLGIVSLILMPVILSSIVLVSLSSARTKAKDARIESALIVERSNSEIYFSDYNSYKGFNISAKASNDIAQNSKNQTKPILVISKDGSSYAIIAKLNDDTNFCVDATGYNGSAAGINKTTALCSK